MAETPKGRVSRASQARAKELQVIEMRRARYDWESIAERVGYRNGDVARQIFKRAIERRTAENVEEIRKEMVETTNAVIQSLYPRMRQGDEKAAAVMLKAMAQLAKYFPGLEAPTEIKVESNPVTMEEAEAFLLGAHEQWKAMQAEHETES